MKLVKLLSVLVFFLLIMPLYTANVVDVYAAIPSEQEHTSSEMVFFYVLSDDSESFDVRATTPPQIAHITHHSVWTGSSSIRLEITNNGPATIHSMSVNIVMLSDDSPPDGIALARSMPLGGLAPGMSVSQSFTAPGGPRVTQANWQLSGMGGNPSRPFQGAVQQSMRSPFARSMDYYYE